MAEQNKAPRPDIRGAEEDRATGRPTGSRSASQDTAYCQCIREGDLWMCAGRPELERDPEGNRCSLGATLAASGSDRDPRAELARALEGGGQDGR